MSNIMMQTAEEDFLKKKRFSAYRWASLCKQLDPFYNNVDKYLQAYRIHAAALSRPHGEIDWYGILGLQDKYASTETITHAFVQLAKLVDPKFHASAAAPKAYKLIVKAWEILSDSESRLAYHARVGLPPPQSQKSVPPKSRKQIPSTKKRFADRNKNKFSRRIR